MYEKRNAFATIVFCSHLCTGEGHKPLEPREWNLLADALIVSELEPYMLLEKPLKDLQDAPGFHGALLQRLEILAQRSAALTFELDKLRNAGIFVVTRSESMYPKTLKQKLKKNAPPLFYYAGDLSLVDEKLLGIVGSRNVSYKDLDFTRKIAAKAVEKGFGIVSGGAKGVDSAATAEALAKDCFSVLFLSDSLSKKLKTTETINAVRKGKLLLLSAAKPDMGFTSGFAMMRNKYIYAASNGTVVVKSDINKGGTWSGAIENLKKDYTPLFCMYQENYSGNTALIQKGAIPIDETWDLSFEAVEPPSTQLSLFDDV